MSCNSYHYRMSRYDQVTLDRSSSLTDYALDLDLVNMCLEVVLCLLMLVFFIYRKDFSAVSDSELFYYLVTLTVFCLQCNCIWSVHRFYATVIRLQRQLCAHNPPDDAKTLICTRRLAGTLYVFQAS